VLGPDGTPLPGKPAEIDGGDEREDGFAFLSDTERLAPAAVPVSVHGDGATSRAAARLHGWLSVDVPATWWRAVAPGPPGHAPQPLLLARATSKRGSITGVWSWRGAVRSADVDGDVVHVNRADGSVHVHRPKSSGWRIDGAAETDTPIELGAGAAVSAALQDSAASSPLEPAEQLERTLTIPYRRVLAELDYRRSEESWHEAGRPTCEVSLEQHGERLVVRVEVPRAERRFVAIDAENPFDNDPAAIHGDGVQLYVDAGERTGGWLLVPITGTSDVATRTAESWRDELPISATWRLLADGYALTAAVTLPPDVAEIGVDVLVNESAPGRERRRGQLVLSGARNEFVFLRSDRHDRSRLLRFMLGAR
jgi:hypothetical protein